MNNRLFHIEELLKTVENEEIIKQLVALHKISIDKSRFGTLKLQTGISIYEEFLKKANIKIFFAQDKLTGVVLGAIVSQVPNKNLNRTLMGVRASLDIALAMIRHPYIWISQTFIDKLFESTYRNSNYIVAIYVKSEVRRSGIGKLLIEFAEDQMQNRSVFVSTKRNNIKAFNFYNGYGFELKRQIAGTVLFEKQG